MLSKLTTHRNRCVRPGPSLGTERSYRFSSWKWDGCLSLRKLPLSWLLEDVTLTETKVKN